MDPWSASGPAVKRYAGVFTSQDDAFNATFDSLTSMAKPKGKGKAGALVPNWKESLCGGQDVPGPKAAGKHVIRDGADSPPLVAGAFEDDEGHGQAVTDGVC
jgi:hypothetical protein